MLHCRDRRKKRPHTELHQRTLAPKANTPPSLPNSCISLCSSEEQPPRCDELFFTMRCWMWCSCNKVCLGGKSDLQKAWGWISSGWSAGSARGRRAGQNSTKKRTHSLTLGFTSPLPSISIKTPHIRTQMNTKKPNPDNTWLLITQDQYAGVYPFRRSICR